MKLVPRLAAMLILCAGALDASAACFVVPAGAGTSMSAGAGGATDYSGSASALLTTCNFVESQTITDFYAPYFVDMAITGISQSSGWQHAIEAGNDLFHVGGGVIHFSALTPGSSDPFTYAFTSTFAGIESKSVVIGVTAAGVSVSTLIPAGPAPFSGQSFYMPGSPDAVAAFAAAVPEPSAWAMMAGGLTLVGFASARRRMG